MAKKVSPIVIPAVIDTSGVDRGVASINSKLKGISGTGVGVGGGGNGNATGNFGTGGGAAASNAGNGIATAAAFGASAGRKYTVTNPFTGGFSAYRDYQEAYRTRGSAAADRIIQRTKTLMNQNPISRMFGRMGVNAGIAGRHFEGHLGIGAALFAGTMGRNLGYIPSASFAKNMSMLPGRAFRGAKAGLQGLNQSGLARFASISSLAALGSYERIVGSQFSDFNAFQGYGKGVSRGISNEFYRSQKTTPNLFQSFMLGAYRKGGKGGLLTGDNGLLTAGARGLRAMSYYAGALLNNPGDTLLNTFNPSSSLWLNAQGINDPYNGARDNQGLGDMLGGMLRNVSFSAQITDQMVQFNAQGAAALATNKRSNQ